MKEDNQLPFIKLYFDDLGRLYDLSPTSKNLFFELCKRVTMDEKFPNVIHLSGQEKQIIAVKIGLAKDKNDKNKYNTNKYLGELVTKKIITKVDANTFILNPEFGARVPEPVIQYLRDMKDMIERINEIGTIKMEITYDVVGRNIITFVEELKDQLPTKRRLDSFGNILL